MDDSAVVRRVYWQNRTNNGTKGETMRSTIFLVLLSSPLFCFSQTDSIFVEKTDGTVKGYPISLINKISFSGIAMNVHEQELIQTVLSSFSLYQNYPNPFNPSTTIQYVLAKGGEVEARIFDIQGRLVRTFPKSFQQVGIHSFMWDSHGDAGSGVASGTYFCQVMFNGSALIKKLVLIK